MHTSIPSSNSTTAIVRQSRPQTLPTSLTHTVRLRRDLVRISRGYHRRTEVGKSLLAEGERVHDAKEGVSTGWFWRRCAGSTWFMKEGTSASHPRGHID
eukprot:2189421-Rhodomonas_salina.4